MRRHGIRHQRIQQLSRERPEGKIFLAILLILIILGSVGFIMAREHMRYDADGNLHFDLPWDKGTSDPVEAPGDPDVVIREPEQTAVKTPVRGRCWRQSR